MKPKDRVDRLLDRARGMAAGKRRAARRRMCRGASWDDLGRILDEALLPGSRPLMAEIWDQVAKYHAMPPWDADGGEPIPNIHGFVSWLGAVRNGTSTLPETMPHALLLAWKNGHRNFPYGGTPTPMRRCEDCLLVMPNFGPDGLGPCITPCPVCGGEDISFKRLSGNQRDGWDPPWVYTPVPG